MLPVKPKCSICGREVTWQRDGTFTDFVYHEYIETELDLEKIICCECKPLELWCPKNPTKSWISINLTEEVRCKMCGEAFGLRSFHGMETLGNSEDNRSYRTKTHWVICQCCSTHEEERREYEA